jgi:hypothetical protein
MLFLRGLQMEATGMTMEPQLTQAIALRALGLTAFISCWPEAIRPCWQRA